MRGFMDEDEDSRAEAAAGVEVSTTAVLLQETPKAILVGLAEYGEVWILKSCVHDDSEVYGGAGKRGKLIVKPWFAEQKGW